MRLAEHALRLTPPASPGRAERLLALAGYLETAGEPQRLTDLLTPELDSLPQGATRARAWLLLSEGGDVRSWEDFERHLDAALAECEGDRGGERVRAGPEGRSRRRQRRGADPRGRGAGARGAGGRAARGPDVERFALNQLGVGSRA